MGPSVKGTERLFCWNFFLGKGTIFGTFFGEGTRGCFGEGASFGVLFGEGTFFGVFSLGRRELSLELFLGKELSLELFWGGLKACRLEPPCERTLFATLSRYGERLDKCLDKCPRLLVRLLLKLVYLQRLPEAIAIC